MNVLTGGTDVHLVLVDLRDCEPELTGRQAEDRLHEIDITVNRNAVPVRPAPADGGLGAAHRHAGARHARAAARGLRRGRRDPRRGADARIRVARRASSPSACRRSSSAIRCTRVSRRRAVDAAATSPARARLRGEVACLDAAAGASPRPRSRAAACLYRPRASQAATRRRPPGAGRPPQLACVDAATPAPAMLCAQPMAHPTELDALYAFLVAAAVTALLTPLTMRLARAVGAIDEPRERGLSETPDAAARRAGDLRRRARRDARCGCPRATATDAPAVARRAARAPP